MEEKQYTPTELKSYWEKYSKTTGFRIQKGGRWVHSFGKPLPRNIDGTRVEIIKLSDVMEFPVYLERYGKN